MDLNKSPYYKNLMRIIYIQKQNILDVVGSMTMSFTESI